MTTLIALALAAQTFTTNPTDDVWVYRHAAAASSDPYIRAWGGESGAITPDGLGGSWSLLKFDLSKLPTNAKISSATLTFTIPGDMESSSKENPVEIRQGPNDFEEENWDFSMATKFLPQSDPKSIFGSAVPTPSADQKDYKVTINLLAGPNDFRKTVSTALATNNKVIGLALTTKLTPEEAGDAGLYKFYSRNAEKAKQPLLKIEFTP